MTRAGLAQALGTAGVPPRRLRQRGAAGAESRPGAGPRRRRRGHRPRRAAAPRAVRARAVADDWRRSGRAAILDALRRGTVPREGLAAFAVGMERFEAAVDADLAAVAGGRGGFKAVRGEYGSGKTFVARWLQERARAAGFATAEVQVSETETPAAPLGDRLPAPRRAPRDLRHPRGRSAARPSTLGSTPSRRTCSPRAGSTPTTRRRWRRPPKPLMERRLAAIATDRARLLGRPPRLPPRAARRRCCALAEGLIAWLGGQPNVAAAVKRAAGSRATSTRSVRCTSSPAS